MRCRRVAVSEKKSGMVTEEEEIRRQREAFVAECREKIRNGKRKFSNAERVAARVLKVDLAELIEEEKEEARNQGYAG